MTTVTRVCVRDLRFPTSRSLIGSDAMNPAPDYSAAALTLETSDTDWSGHSFVFTIGRGNNVQVAAIEEAAQRFTGRDADGLCADPAAAMRELAWDSQLRWLGPDKGVMHMAIGAVVNAIWDLRSRRAGIPLWRELCQLSPTEVVDQIDWTYLRDCLDPGEARELLEEQAPLRDSRRACFEQLGLAAYTTSPGWLGYSDGKLERLCVEAREAGFSLVKLKVGEDLDSDLRRLEIARHALGASVDIAVDANQRWDVETAIASVRAFADFNLRWVEEPTHPDDVLGHATIAHAVAPTPIATGEHLANPVMAKQLLAAGGASVLQIDATRVGGVNDLLALIMLARKSKVEVIPHAGGVGLCEAVQHFVYFNAVCVAHDTAPLSLEYVDHLHEHMADPVTVTGGAYRLPTSPGSSSEFVAGVERRYGFPDGTEWIS
ncbi:enolase C-terminal domain-like protein [Candidatus Poriferisocius sp.]|uniref:enolase C-terminal domain-like protein n=1 Tax=Candidatus Poriferisocius sp. TaxID=3101276 RepID=UPI003B02B182